MGLAFQEQVLEDLPVTSEDVPMDLVVTEAETFKGLCRDLQIFDS